MGSFKRGFLGYRRAEVDAAIAARDARVGEVERELSCLSGIVIEREREIGDLREQLRQANETRDGTLASLELMSSRVAEIEAQARGQATRIRMKALREAVEVSRRVQELTERIEAEPALAGTTAELSGFAPEPNGNGGGIAALPAPQVFEGPVRVDIGPLADFSQLVSFEDAAAQIAATTEISVERFSEGRATLAIRLEQPVDLLGELESRSPLGFSVRHAGGDSLVLDVDVEQQGAQKQAA